jgi:SAM-dependent methyltransferase
MKIGGRVQNPSRRQIASIVRPCPACNASDAQDVGEKNGYLLQRCAQCSTLYTRGRAESSYDDTYVKEGVPAALFLSKRLDRIVASFESFRHLGRLLDVGFGGGDLLDAAQRSCWRTSGVEVTALAVANARRRGIDAFHGTLADAKYESESFDVVIATEILEHLVEAAELLAEIRRVIRPGGLMWATTPHGRGVSARMLGLGWSVIAPPEHVQLFSVSGIRELLERTGFQVLSVRAEGVNPQELIQHLRGGNTSTEQRIDAAYALNAFFEERPYRRIIKAVINRPLSMFQLGDSLKIAAIRR